MKQIICAILIHFVLCSFISAYEAPKASVFGSMGLSVFDDKRDSNDKLTNLEFGFGVAFRTSSHVGFRADVNYFSDSRDHVAYPYDIKLWDFGGDFIYYFTDTNHQPYAFAGARLLNYHQVSDAPSLPGVYEITVNSFGLDFGGGIESFISRSISIRPEFRFVYDADLDEHNDAHSNMLSLTGAIAYHW
ncbi:porin family protein [bacterium]|nr:porin family protein [bacterium]